MYGIKWFFLYVTIVVLLASFNGCTPNNPYPSSDRHKNIFYTTFSERPKHLDSARSYSSNEYELIGQIYEPPLQYHYLKRPYTLIPLTVEAVPKPIYLDKNNKKLPHDVEPDKVFISIYEIRIKKGIMYQNHPAFAKDDGGNFLYRNLIEKDLKGISGIRDFPFIGSKELTSDDYIYQIYRLADPSTQSPILPILEKYILGLGEYSRLIGKDVEAVSGTPGRRRKNGESITADYKKHELKGVERIDRYTLRIILKGKYPQFIYWLAMPFFAPMPEEVDLFYRQRVLEERNITLDRFPVGTGPYRIDTYKPEQEIILVKNENFHIETYPTEGEKKDREKGLLADAGRRLPFIEKIVFKLEKEDIPRWNKFLQGYFDSSGIASDSFDQAVNITAEGRIELTDFMEKKNITLATSVRPSTYYTGFNMLDKTVGGLDEKKKKLRQAISIALDYEEFIEVFNNGRGIPAMGPIPPGIFGYVEGSGGINPFVYKWDNTKNKPVRKSIEEAKALLKEAGYAEGRDKDGSPLIITFDNSWTGAESASMINWFIKKFRLLGIKLENRTTDYNRFQEKMLNGNFQFFFLGVERRLSRP